MHNRKRIGKALILISAAALAGGALAARQAWPYLTRTHPAAPTRPAKWAQPLQRPGLPNLHKVNDQLYRGARPDKEGYAQLKAMGVKTVVNLDFLTPESTLVEAAGLEYRHVYMKAWHAEQEDVVAFLKIVTDAKLAPVFAHCQHGADRTGTMCAAYRVIVDGWDVEAAIQEMTEGGYGYHTVWENLVKYLRAMDAQAIADKAGLKLPKG